MANGFYHKDIIHSLRDNFVKWVNKKLDPDLGSIIRWEFPDKPFENSTVSGEGSKEIKVIYTKFLIKGLEIPINFMEDYEGNLTIMVNNKFSYLVKPKEGISSGLLKSLAKSIEDAI